MEELSPVTTREKTDLSKNENRAIRGERQYEFEKDIDSLSGESIAERFLEVRKKMFGDFLSTTGQRMDQLVSDKAPSGYPNRELLSEKLLPNFYKLTDRLYEEIQQEEDPMKKSEMGKRLATMAYFTGITLHQAPDGNGQTNKLIALSYIREFCPQYQDSFFPAKYDDGDDENSLYDKKSDLVSIPFKIPESTLPPQVKEEDQKLFDKIEKLIEVDDRGRIKDEPPEGWDALRKKSFELMRDILQDVEDVQFSEETLQLLYAGRKTDLRLISLNVRRDISRTLDKKYPGYHFSESGDFPPVRVHFSIPKEFTMTALLAEEDGRKALEEYVLNGSDAMKNYEPKVGGEKFGRFYANTADTFQFLEGEFDRVLLAETTEVHEEKHRKYLEKKQTTL